MPCKETSTVEGAALACEIVLGNAFLVHYGLFSDFIAEIICRLAYLLYSNLREVLLPRRSGGQLLTCSPEPAQAMLHNLGF